MENETYIVEQGDTLISIARKYGIRVVDLIETNNLEDVYDLTVGMQLIIPVNQPYGFSYYTVKQGDTLYSIANIHNISLENLAEINGLEIGEYIFPNQLLLVPNEGVYAYITREGDTLKNIANDLGVNQEDILVYNKRIYLLPEQLIAYRVKNNS